MADLERRTVTFTTTLLLVFLFLSGLFWYGNGPAPTTTVNVPTQQQHTSDRGRHTAQDLLCGHDHVEQPPGSTTVPRTFGRMAKLEDLSPAGDNAWATETATRGGGFLAVRYNATMTQGYGLSMFHALHCLQMIRLALQEQRAEGCAGESGGGDKVGRADPHHLHDSGGRGSGGGAGNVDYEHVAHCFSYVAESLLCAADGTIEPPTEEFNERGHLVSSNVDGAGVVHQCKDASLLWKVTQDSERRPVERWEYRAGDTVQSVFGQAL
ncbi:hypothetical protein CLAIMM_06971 [Cladophialophora immunda]|nr:hypothetical protein CLAIMM_06971 [Cladophialophora immunda]